MQELAKAHASVPTIAELTPTLRELAALPAAHGTFNVLFSLARRCGHRSTHLHHGLRQHPFVPASLQDEDVTVDFARLTSVDDRVATWSASMATVAGSTTWRWH